jgi:sensor c-di-GMP phosphodiesterase-like protein
MSIYINGSNTDMVNPSVNPLTSETKMETRNSPKLVNNISKSEVNSMNIPSYSEYKNINKIAINIPVKLSSFSEHKPNTQNNKTQVNKFSSEFIGQTSKMESLSETPSICKPLLEKQENTHNYITIIIIAGAVVLCLIIVLIIVYIMFARKSKKSIGFDLNNSNDIVYTPITSVKTKPTSYLDIQNINDPYLEKL